MFKTHKTAVYAVLILSATFTYLILNSDSNTKKTVNADGLEEAGFASLTEDDINDIAAVKERMKLVVLPTSATPH